MEESVAPGLVFAAALALALVHLFAGALRRLDGIPRSRWLSGAAGVSVAYVVVHLLPELASVQEHLDEESGVLPYLERHAYLMALAGLALFYAVERASITSRAEAGGDHTGRGVFWLSTASFATYNALIGYLLVHGETETSRGVALFTVALGLHFVINDRALREHHKQAYHRVARWILAAAVLAGWAIGRATQISEAALGLVLAFIAGGVILNVIKEELPDERRARVIPFLGGAGGYAALLVAL